MAICFSAPAKLVMLPELIQQAPESLMSLPSSSPSRLTQFPPSLAITLTVIGVSPTSSGPSSSSVVSSAAGSSTCGRVRPYFRFGSANEISFAISTPLIFVMRSATRA